MTTPNKKNVRCLIEDLKEGLGRSMSVLEDLEEALNLHPDLRRLEKSLIEADESLSFVTGSLEKEQKTLGAEG